MPNNDGEVFIRLMIVGLVMVIVGNPLTVYKIIMDIISLITWPFISATLTIIGASIFLVGALFLFIYLVVN